MVGVPRDGGCARIAKDEPGVVIFVEDGIFCGNLIDVRVVRDTPQRAIGTGTDCDQRV